MTKRFLTGLVFVSVLALTLLLPACAAHPVLAAAGTQPAASPCAGACCGAAAVLQSTATPATAACCTTAAALPAHAFASYDQLLTLAGQTAPMQTKVWMGGLQARFEQASGGVTLVSLVDGASHLQYSFTSSQKIASKSDLSALTAMPLATTSAWEWAQMVIKNPDSTAPGPCQRVDGLHCFVVETPYQGDTLKTWMSDDYGLPLRIEFQGNVIEFKNFVFASQPDSLFQLPAGVTLQK